MIFTLSTFPSNTELARLTATAQLAEKLCKVNVARLSVVVIEALVWSIERYPEKPACYGAFSLRRES